MYSLKADPMLQGTAADSLEADLSRLQEHVRSFYAVLAASSGYWQGDAADAARKSGRQCAADADEHCEALRALIEKLRQMALLYRQTEEMACRAAAELPVAGL